MSAASTTHALAPVIEAHRVGIVAPGGRPLLADLNLSMTRESVALVGRNGVGKSSLLEVLSGNEPPHRGRVSCRGSSLLVRQRLDEQQPPDIRRLFAKSTRAVMRDESIARAFEAAGLGAVAGFAQPPNVSRGERRKLQLLAALSRQPDVLLLDEPTEDLDVTGIDWLSTQLGSWTGALLVVTHHRELLSHFRHFFVIEEAGSRYFGGTFAELERNLEQRHHKAQRRYVRRLHALGEQQRHDETVGRRRRRKKNLGRLHEEARAPSRAQLKGKKGYAEVSQGKAAKLREKRIENVRSWALASRRALRVNLPLALAMPSLPPDDGQANIALCHVSASMAARVLFTGLDLTVGRDRVGIIGPNGSGKTTLLRVMTQQRTPDEGRVVFRGKSVGHIEQGATNGLFQDSLAQHLLVQTHAGSLEDVARILLAHRFPLALAQRAVRSLSPGERMRAVLIALFQRRPALELLVLDEPTSGLDFVGAAALAASLRAWPGGLVLTSHDRGFLDRVGIDRYLELDGRGEHEVRCVAAKPASRDPSLKPAPT